MITVLGMSLQSLVSGAIITEQVLHGRESVSWQ